MSTALDVVLPDGSRQTSDAILQPWLDRAKQARKARRPLEAQWMTNQAFAAGRQWAVYMPREHRVLDDPRRKQYGRSMQVSDVLTQYVWTAIGKLAADDFRPQLLFSRTDEEAEQYAEQANLAFGWGWDEEWRGDEKLLDLLRVLAVLGTGAIRCRYDRQQGKLLGDVPHAPQGGYVYTDPETRAVQQFAAGKPILDPAAARAHVADRKYYGEPIDLRPLREGAVSWELLSPWNMLPPPGVEYAADFPWEIVVRPVHIDQLKETYGDRAEGVPTDDIEAMTLLGMRELAQSSGSQQATDNPAKLRDHALVYTGYARPTSDYPKGQRVVWAGDDGHLLDVEASLPYTAEPYGPRSGITYFSYWPVTGRFWGRALIEPGIGPQRRRNKRVSQIDEIIDRGLPRSWAEEGSFDPDTMTGNPLEVVWVKPGSTLPKTDGGIAPGAWMIEDLNGCDNDIEKALGIKGVSLGDQPTGVSAYSAMALLSENDATKLNPISKRFKLGTADVGRDSFEAMKNWPDGKQLMIAGEDDTLQVVVFKKATLPASYYVRPAKGGTLPRSQASEIQKVADLWNAAEVSQAVAQDPVAWLEWYKASLDAGKAEELPKMADGSEQRHKAALENVVMVRTGQVLPVAPYDDPQVHVEEHTNEMEQLSAAASMGDEDAARGVQVIGQHRLLHLQMAQQNAVMNTAAAPPAPGGATIDPMDVMYENTLQTPRLPRAGTNFGFR